MSNNTTCDTCGLPIPACNALARYREAARYLELGRIEAAKGAIASARDEEARFQEQIEAQKATETYFDWDDAALGRYAKEIARTLERCKDDAEGFHRLTACSAAMLLIGTCIDSNAATLNLDLDGFAHDGEESGDWRVTVQKKSADHEDAQ